MSVTSPKRPVLRYHGGKWLLAPWIIGHFPDHRVYVEPYAGAASVLLRKPRANGECINDLDGEIINLFRVLRCPASARELERTVRLTPYGREEYESAYLVASDPVEQARRTLIKSFMGFGADGLLATWTTGFRDNLTRGGGIPARDWSNFADAIEDIAGRLAGVVIENRPALQVIRKHDTPGSLFYVDPPYPHSTRTGGTKHSYRHELTDANHRELAATLHSLAGMVVLSGYPCTLYDAELYPTWRRVERAAHADGARDRTEVLWINPAADAVLRRERRQPALFGGDI